MRSDENIVTVELIQPSLLASWRYSLQASWPVNFYPVKCEAYLFGAKPISPKSTNLQ